MSSLQPITTLPGHFLKLVSFSGKVNGSQSLQGGEMAQAAVQLDPEILSCCLCLELLKSPVTIPCGHSYCRKCLQQHWDEQKKQRKVHDCPQCRRAFNQRPILEKNTVLAALVETLEKTGLQVQAAPADQSHPEPGYVACDVCTGRNVKALKSCLDCWASYCDSHLQPHLNSSTFKKHKLVEPSQKLQENICPRHDEVMKLFCRTDQKLICGFCSVDEHKGHDTVAAAVERTERQRELDETRQKIQQKIQCTEEDLKVLQKEVDSINSSADKAVKDSEKSLTQMICLLEKRRSEVQQQVRSTQRAEVSRVSELQKTLEQEMMELKRRDTELEKISHTLDHSQFLSKFSSLQTHSASPNISNLEIHPKIYFEDVTVAVAKLRDEIQRVLMESEKSVSWTVSNVGVPLPQPEQEPRGREDFLRYYRKLTLDPNTVNKCLLLSEEDRKVTNMGEDQHHNDHPDRFTEWWQVLSREGLTGRCYWEVEWGGWWWGGVGLAVTYKTIARAGTTEESEFGSNDKSWRLYCSSDGYDFHHDNVTTYFSGAESSRLGVYLDHRAGLLSFYSISGTMELLYRVKTTFTQPLYVGLGVNPGSAAELMEL